MLSSADDLLAAVFRTWNIPTSLTDAVVLEVSPRLRTSLGICYPDRKLIRLHPLLVEPKNEDLLREVVCHESAHIVAPFKAGRRVKPHGPEWQALVAECGYKPRIRIEVPGFPTPSQERTRVKKAPRSYEHRCPVCQTWRLASRPQQRWRCAECVDSGLDGKLSITSLSSAKSKGATTR